MQSLACQLDFPLKDERARSTPRELSNNTDLCPQCGHELFGPDAGACSWQSWGTFWETLGLRHVDLVCSSCGEYRREFLNGSK